MSMSAMLRHQTIPLDSPSMRRFKGLLLLNYQRISYSCYSCSQIHDFIIIDIVSCHWNRGVKWCHGVTWCFIIICWFVQHSHETCENEILRKVRLQYRWQVRGSWINEWVVTHLSCNALSTVLREKPRKTSFEQVETMSSMCCVHDWLALVN